MPRKVRNGAAELGENDFDFDVEGNLGIKGGESHVLQPPESPPLPLNSGGGLKDAGKLFADSYMSAKEAKEEKKELEKSKKVKKVAKGATF